MARGDLAGAGYELAGVAADLAGLQSVLLMRKLALLGRRDVSAGGWGDMVTAGRQAYKIGWNKDSYMYGKNRGHIRR